MGMLFASEEEELIEKKLKAHRLSQEYNLLFEKDNEKRQHVLKELLSKIGERHIYAWTYSLSLWLPHKNWRTLLYEFQFYRAR